MPPKVCARRGCVALTYNRHCDLHAAEAKKDRDTWIDANRASSAKRGYDHKWRYIRSLFLKQNPLCKECQRVATDVDHIIALRDGGTNKFTNLQALCHSCHSRKTARENNRWGKRNVRDGGMGSNPLDPKRQDRPIQSRAFGRENNE